MYGDAWAGRRPPRRVIVVSASVGCGHDGAARELSRRLADQGFRVEIVDFLAAMPWITGRMIRRTYLWQQRVAPWTYAWLYRILDRHACCAALACAIAGLACRRLRLACSRPDVSLVVSTYPLASQALGKLRRRGRLRVPVVTYLTDFSVHRLWVCPGVDLHLALHPITQRQATALGAKQVRVVGPLVSPRFGRRFGRRDGTRAGTRAASRTRLGLPPNGRLAVLTAGSWGVGQVAEAATELADSGVVTPVVVCGRNDHLRRELAERFGADGRGVVLGWVADMASLFAACDLVVQNAGGLTCLEALASDVPVASYRCISGHGLANAAAMDEAGVAVWVREPRQLASCLLELADGVRGRRQVQAGAALFAGEDPALVCAHIASLGPQAVPRRRPWATTVAAGVALGMTWLATEGTDVAVAHGLGAAHVKANQQEDLFVVVHPSEREMPSPALAGALARARAAVAVDRGLIRAQPQAVRELADSGVPLVNAGAGPPYRTGIVGRRSAIVGTARALQRLTGHPSRLFLSDRDLDSIDVGLARLEHEKIVVPTASVRPGQPVPSLRGGEVVLIEGAQANQRYTLNALAAVDADAATMSLRLAPVTELAP